MAEKKHAEWLREGVGSWNRRRKKVSFSPDLSGIRFYDFLPPDFRDNPKTSRYFEKIDLSDTDLSRADLSNLNFAHAKFSGSNLSESNLSKSNFEGAEFSNADLSGADASTSLFSGGMFESTKLDGVVFFGATVAGATFIASAPPRDQLELAEFEATSIFSDRKTYNEYMVSLASSPRRLRSITGVTDKQQAEVGKTTKYKYDVFFATNRDPIYSRGELRDFGPNNLQELTYGVCEVIVPDGHRIGSLGSPLWKRLVNRKDDRLKLDSLISLSEDLYWKLLRDTAERMNVREHPTIYVHGFNTTFKQAVLRSAQIGYDLGIGQGIGLFSWPSKGAALKYSADEATVEASKYLLAEFVDRFVRNSQQGKINIIAHSMGCRCVIGALEVLSNGRKSTLKRVNQVIMAAADIDSATMPYQGRLAARHCKRLTSYVSGLDTALRVSGWLHSYPRVGITPPTFVLDGMDTVLVNDLSLGEFSHSYLSSSRTILSDVFALLKSNTPPSERHAIEAVSEGDAVFWRMKL